MSIPKETDVLRERQFEPLERLLHTPRLPVQKVVNRRRSNVLLILNCFIVIGVAAIVWRGYLILLEGTSLPERWAAWKRQRRGATETIPASWNGVGFFFNFAEESQPIAFAHPSLKRRLNEFLVEVKSKQDLTGLDHLGIYADRYVEGTSTLSTHADGKAIDIAGLRFADGRRLAVSEHDQPEKAKQLRELASLLRQHFDVVLDWDYDAKHANHFHAEVR
jgi:hypothetical protein